MFTTVLHSHRLSTGQDATEAFEDVGHSDEARALLPKLFVGDLERDSVSDHTALLQLHYHTYHCLPSPLQGVKLKLGATAADESRESGSKCVFLSSPYLLPLTHSSLNYQQYDVLLGASGTTRYILWMGLLYWVCLTA